MLRYVFPNPWMFGQTLSNPGAIGRTFPNPRIILYHLGPSSRLLRHPRANPRLLGKGVSNPGRVRSLSDPRHIPGGADELAPSPRRAAAGPLADAGLRHRGLLLRPEAPDARPPPGALRALQPVLPPGWPGSLPCVVRGALLLRLLLPPLHPPARAPRDGASQAGRDEAASRPGVVLREVREKVNPGSSNTTIKSNDQEPLLQNSRACKA